MNKLNKIFLIIIIILVISLGIVAYLYFDMKEKAIVLRDGYIDLATDVYDTALEQEQNNPNNTN